jgi:heptosyltransferase-2
LVVGPSWIGDTILAQPLFKLLCTRHGAVSLDVLAPQWTAPLLARMPEVRRVLDLPAGHGELQLARQWRTAREVAGEAYEQAIVLPNSFKSALVPWLARIPIRTGYRGELRYGLLNDARRVDGLRHPQIAQRYAALALERGESLPAALPFPRLRVDDRQRSATLARLGLDPDRSAVALCPGAEYGPAKRWPVRHYGILAQRLGALGHAVWLVGSAGDAGTGAEIARLAPDAARNLCGRTTLAEAVDVLASTRLVVSNDSGLMHVAAALDRPVFALFGSSSPAYTPPLSPHARILRLDLPCSPCFERECPLGHLKCLVELTPDRVLAEIESAGAQGGGILDKKPERH